MNYQYKARERITFNIEELEAIWKDAHFQTAKLKRQLRGRTTSPDITIKLLLFDYKKARRLDQKISKHLSKARTKQEELDAKARAELRVKYQNEAQAEEAEKAARHARFLLDQHASETDQDSYIMALTILHDYPDLIEMPKGFYDETGTRAERVKAALVIARQRKEAEAIQRQEEAEKGYCLEY